MGCQKKIAAAIVDKGADYVLALKDNQPTLHDDVASFFRHAEAEDWKDTPHSFDETTDKGHGRVEVRRVLASSEIDWLDPEHAWKGLRTVAMIERVRTSGEKTSTERAYYMKPDAPCSSSPPRSSSSISARRSPRACSIAASTTTRRSGGLPRPLGQRECDGARATCIRSAEHRRDRSADDAAVRCSRCSTRGRQ